MNKCDFCSAPFPVAVYPVREGEPWAACTECAALIDTEEIQALARRAAHTLLGGFGEYTGRTGWLLKEAIEAIHHTFWKLRSGPRQGWTRPPAPFLGDT